jgi:rhodanese-related sulfurtransferase
MDKYKGGIMSDGGSVKGVSALELYQRMTAPEGQWPKRSWALFDVRESGEAERGHIEAATFLPRRQIEFRIATLVPARATPVIVYDDGDGRAQLAADTLARLDYTNVQVLVGGLPAWRDAGYPLHTGSNVPSKDFGERVLTEGAVPYIDPASLKERIAVGERILVCDSRTPGEFARICIPGAYSVPSFDLTLHAFGLADSYDHIIVNCAGRTRSIIGTSTLQALGLDRVSALENGTMGWTLSGFQLENGADRTLPPPSESSIERGERAAAHLVADRPIKRIEPAALEAMLSAHGERNAYIFDVRGLEEFSAGHVAGSIFLPGGQACQRTDDFLAVQYADIVFIDEMEARALVTAYWFDRMGFSHLHVLAGGMAAWRKTGRPVETGRARGRPLGLDDVRALHTPLPAHAFAGWLAARPDAVVIDVGTSRQFEAGHLPEAHWMPRGWLELRIGEHATQQTAVGVTAADEVQGLFAAATLHRLGFVDVAVLAGGTRTWTGEGRALVTGAPSGFDQNDLVEPPYEKGKDAMLAYLDWETKLGHKYEAATDNRRG